MARAIEELINYIGDRCSLSTYNEDTGEGNIRADTPDTNKGIETTTRIEQVVLRQGPPLNASPATLGVRSGTVVVDVYGETEQAHNLAVQIYQLFQHAPSFSQGDISFWRVVPMESDITLRGIMWGDTVCYYLTLAVMYMEV